MSAVLQHNDLFRYGPKCDAEPIANGIEQVLLGSTDQLVQSKTWYERGTEMTVSSNARTRASYVLEGFFEICVAGQSQILGPTGSFIVPTDVGFSIRCLEDGALLTTHAAQTSDPDRHQRKKQPCRQHAHQSALTSASTRSKTFD